MKKSIFISLTLVIFIYFMGCGSKDPIEQYKKTVDELISILKDNKSNPKDAGKKCTEFIKKNQATMDRLIVSIVDTFRNLPETEKKDFRDRFLAIGEDEESRKLLTTLFESKEFMYEAKEGLIILNNLYDKAPDMRK